MRKVFNYTKFTNEAQNTLVESFVALANSWVDGKGNTPEYKEANEQFNEAFMRECVEAIPNTTFVGLEQCKDPMIHNDMFFVHRFNTLLAQMITRATCCYTKLTKVA